MMMKALVAEDDRLNRELIRRMLRRLGWDVVAVANGAAALDACAATEYDVVLIDYEMPRMNGVEAATKLREFDQARARHTSLVIVTGSDPEPLQRIGLFDGIILKPFAIEELQSGIESALARRARPHGLSPLG